MRWVRYNSRHWEVSKSIAPLFHHPESLRLPASLSQYSRIWSKRMLSAQTKHDPSTEQRESDHHEEKDSSSAIEANDYTQRTTTITARERETFDRIFRRIVASAPSVEGRRSLPGDHIGFLEDRHKGEDLSGRLSPTLRRIEADGNWQRDDLSFNPGTYEKTMMDQELREVDLRDVMRYPESLRAAAAETIRKVQRLSQDQSPPTTTTKPAEVEEDGPHQKELDRVVKLMRSAKADRDLWAVLEDEVFSMVRRLDEEDGRSQVKNARRRRGQRSDAGQAFEDDHVKPTSQDTLPPLTIIGPNYPHLLLLAMRIFRHDFRLPSACLALFAQVRSLGPISYVLGATTTLYNEIIAVKWRSYGDFRGIEEVLMEMDRGGVEFDGETLSLLREIGKERGSVVRGEHGSVMRDLWHLDAFREGLRRVAAWKGFVDESLIEKAIATRSSGRE